MAYRLGVKPGKAASVVGMVVGSLSRQRAHGNDREGDQQGGRQGAALQ